MKTKRLIGLVVTALLTWVPYALHADDTDIYINNGGGSQSKPMVMFSLDYRANLTSTQCRKASDPDCLQAAYFRSNPLTKADVDAIGAGKFYFFDTLRLALKVALGDPSKPGFLYEGWRFGFMMSHSNASVPGNVAAIPNCVGCSNGGAILRGFMPAQKNDADGSLSELHRMLAQLRSLKDGGNAPDHAYQGAEMYFEFFRYLTGQGIFNGHNGAVDFEQGKSVDIASPMNKYRPTSINVAPHTWPDGRIETADEKSYISPLDKDEECTQLAAVNLFFGNSNQDNDSKDAINAAKAAGGMRPGLVGTNDAYLRTVEFLRNNDLGDGTFGTAANVSGDQSVTSYFLYDGNASNTVGQYAEAGGTTPRLVSDDPAQVVAAFGEIFSEILSVSTTFVAASIPVNVFNRAGVVDNVYIALFQADPEGRPYWPGNVKKLKINSTNPNNPFLQDATGASAIQDSDGRVRSSALSYWTDTTDPRLNVIDDNDTPDDLTDDTPVGKDGRRVPRGGSGQKIPGYLSAEGPGLTNAATGARQLLYLNGTTLSALDATASNAASTSALYAALRAANTTEATELLRYLRGLQATGTSTSPRTWMMGDALHSRPLPINYGKLSTGAGTYSESNPGIFVAVGSNDGYMRLIQNTTPGGTESGQEVWAFMPPESMYSQRYGFRPQSLLLKNDMGSTPRHPYTVDGAPVSFVFDENMDGTISGSDRVFLYFGLRRGGLAYYALDITKPLEPKFLWKIDSTTSNFTELGLSFSTPRTGFVQSSTGAPKPVLVFAGGYDDNKDRRDGVGTDDNEGRAIYVVDARDGTLIWKAVAGGATGPTGDDRVFTHADLRDSIPSDVAAVDTNGDNLIDRIVVGDSGGNLWRADLPGSDTKKWKLTLLAKLGRHAEGGKGGDRRFFHEPDIIQTKDANGAFDAVVIESGDREDPLDKGGVTVNSLYMVRDSSIGIGSSMDRSTVHSDLTDLTNVNCGVEGTLPKACSETGRGWRITLETTGEKGLAAPLTFNNVVFFTTYLPKSSAGVCAPDEGAGRLYAVRLQNGAPVFREYDGDTSALKLSDRYDNLDSPGIPAQVVYVPGSSERTILRPDLKFGDAPGSNRFRGFWRRGETPPRSAP